MRAFGGTREVAEAVAEGLRAAPGVAVDCRPVVDAGPALGQVNLLVVGGRTHFLSMSSQRSRRIVRQLPGAGRRAPSPPGGGKHPAGPGVREWLAALPQAPGGRRAAVFDTRLITLFPGSAARLIARSLEDHGYEVITRPEGFLAENMLGPLSAGNATGRGRGIGTRRVASAGTPGIIAVFRRTRAGGGTSGPAGRMTAATITYTGGRTPPAAPQCPAGDLAPPTPVTPRHDSDQARLPRSKEYTAALSGAVHASCERHESPASPALCMRIISGHGNACNWIRRIHAGLAELARGRPGHVRSGRPHTRQLRRRRGT
jgi:hypothetical protein